jgi:SAM-dependent methyltransferase
MRATSIGTWAPTPTFLYRHHIYKRLLAGSQNQSLLDIGTGNGYLVSHLASQGFHGDALDFSASAITYAQAHMPAKSRIKLHLCDFTDFPTEKKYGQVLCFEVLEYIQNPAAFLKKAAAHLNPGGRLLLSAPAHRHLWTQNDTKRGHLHRFQRPELESMLAQASLTPIRVWSYGYPLLTLLRHLNRSGHLVQQTSTKPLAQLSQESSLVQEYNPRLKFLFNPATLLPLFLLMDLFLNTNRGLGYVIEARKQ